MFFFTEKFKNLYFILLTIFSSYTTFSQLKENTIYLIPGQGSDYRIYKYFKLQNIDTVHIHFVIPNKNEKMKSYAQRLSKQIDTSKTFSIIGVSLVGYACVRNVGTFKA